MTARRRVPTPAPDSSATAAALAALDAKELRGLIRDLIPWLDESSHARLVNAVIDRAARNESDWVPAGPTDQAVADIVSFAQAATRVGHADPSDVDDYLRQGSNAFLRKDYRAASEIFRALLIPIGDVDIDLGQHEMLDEVLGVDVAACAAQYVVSVYMTARPPTRGEAVLSVIDEMRGIGRFWEPLREMERVAVEPLPEFDGFLSRWRELVEARAGTSRDNDWATDEDRWRREVVGRLEGAEGIAKLARSTKRADDLGAWCRLLVEARDWKAALAAYEEAAELVTDKKPWRGEFLDGAALAAQRLGRADLPDRLARAWQQAPSLVRLRRWLGSSTSKRELGRRATAALDTCPKQARRQRALLHILVGDVEAAARLLSVAPGLGWSSEEHPGHLLFPLFCGLLGRVEPPTEPARDFDELNALADDEPRLSTPEVGELIELAGVGAPDDSKTRTAVLRAMRTAAEKRIKGVTGHQRRRHYSHAAALAVACVRVDDSRETAAWLATIRDTYRRYPALQRELARRGGA